VNNKNLEKGVPYRFQPGQSGNPGGRPKQRPISDCYEEMAGRELPENVRIQHGLPEGATYGEALAMVMFKHALEGKTDAAREIREAIEGKTGNRQEVSQNRDVQIRVTYDDELLSSDVKGPSKITE
jgi:Family of unknown function (DUF5681)